MSEMNKYKEAFQRWKGYNFKPETIPDEVDEASKVFDQMEHDYDLVQEALEIAWLVKEKRKELQEERDSYTPSQVAMSGPGAFSDLELLNDILTVIS